MIQKSAGGVVTRFFYNVEDRLVRVEDSSGTVIARYGYDPFGRRLWKDVSGTRTYFHYSDEGLVGEYDAAGSMIKTYGWQPGSTWGTDPLFMRQDGKYYWYHNDHLGTPQKMTSSSGAVVWTATYGAFGEASIGSDIVGNHLRFAGQYYDSETGLHYNWHRYYDPKAGRYLRVDPIGLAGGINLYAYSLNNPIDYIDPYGQNPMGAILGVLFIADFVIDMYNDIRDSTSVDINSEGQIVVTSQSQWHIPLIQFKFQTVYDENFNKMDDDIMFTFPSQHTWNLDVTDPWRLELTYVPNENSCEQ